MGCDISPILSALIEWEPFFYPTGWLIKRKAANIRKAAFVKNFDELLFRHGCNHLFTMPIITMT